MFYSYTLQEGDSFWTVSSKVYGSVRYCDRIAEANPGLRSTSLRPGRTIRVPAIPGVRMLTDLPPAGTFAGSAGTFVEARSVEVPQAGNRRPDAAGVVPGGASAMPRPGQAATSPPAGPPLPAAPAGVRARDAAARSAPGSDPATTPAGIPTAVAGLGATGANPPAGTPASDSGKTHTVAKGDTLAGLSRKYYGDEKHWKRIADANPDADPARLKTGAVLKIPPASR
ncbi:MAG: LysM peptidoglycan-binding domain-containing protein [Planctomycetota bacterium]|nr:LysM peptidoglycan-binding domain-containing protein [Planctomycetota bacterium]